MTKALHPRLAQAKQEAWSYFLDRYDPLAQLSSDQCATIRQLYQALRQCGYDPKCKTGEARYPL